MDEGSRSRWIAVVVVCLTTMVGFMAWSSAFPLLNLWVRDLGISRAQGGLLTGLFYLPGIFVAMPASWLFSRYPLRRVFLACWLLILAGAWVMSSAPGFLLLCMGRLVYSVGMNLHAVGAPKLLAAWFDRRRGLGVVMALYSVSVSIGVLGGIGLAGRIGNDYGWRAAALMIVALTAVGFLLMLLVRQPPSLSTPAATSVPFRPFELGWLGWVLAAGYFFFNIGSDSYLVFAPDYLVSRGFALGTASALVGSYAYAAMATKLTAAPFLKAANAAWYVSAGCVFGVLSNILLLTAARSPLVSVLAMGLAFGLAMPALYAMPAFVFGSQRSGTAYGLYQLVYSLGALVQPIVGYTVDRTGSYVWGYGLLSAFFVAGVACILTVRYCGARQERT
jgi:MFS family permease